MKEDTLSKKLGLMTNKNVMESHLQLPCIAFGSEFICGKLKDTKICLLATCCFYNGESIRDDDDISIEELAEEMDLCRPKFLQSQKYVDFVENEIPKTLQPAYLFLDRHPDNTFKNRNNFIWNMDKKLSFFNLSQRQLSRLGRLMWGEHYNQVLEEKKQLLEDQHSEEIRERIMRGEYSGQP